jgi:hypothetical protein
LPFWILRFAQHDRKIQLGERPTNPATVLLKAAPVAPNKKARRWSLAEKTIALVAVQ